MTWSPWTLIFSLACVGAFVLCVRARAVLPWAVFQLLFVLLTLAATAFLVTLDGRGVRGLLGGLGWFLFLTWVWALGEEMARGVSLRLTVETRTVRDALIAAAASGLMLGLVERLLKTTHASVALPLALQIAGQLRAVLFHPAISVLVILLRRRWRWPLWATIGLCSLAHATMNLAPHLIYTRSVAIEILEGYALSTLALVAILALALREAARRPG